jgi:hypothetical protein
MASCGRNWSSANGSLTSLSGSAITATLVTSDPVPAVVGMTMAGKQPFVAAKKIGAHVILKLAPFDGQGDWQPWRYR